MGPLLAGPQVPLSAWEIWACANTVLKTHGDKAPLHIAEQIGALALKGDLEGINTWQEIAVRIRSPLRRHGPIPAAHGVVCWRLVDLGQWIWDEFGLLVTRFTRGRELRAMGYRKLSARPRHHGQRAEDIADFKKASQPAWQRSKGVSRGARR